MMVIDSGVSNASLLVSRSLRVCNRRVLPEISERIRRMVRALASELKERFLGRRVTVNGRSINDDRGCMIQAGSP